MPIFMDRHDIPGLTAMDVAEGHKQDLKIQHKYNCRALTYWYDEEKEIAFCLIEAPQKAAVKKLHGDSHGLIPNQIIEVESDLVESFLGRIKDPETTDDSEFFRSIDPAFRIIMVVELKDAALIKSKLGEVKGTKLLRTHNQFIQKEIKQHGGREAEHSGRSLMASFSSTSRAIECALHIQKHLREQNRQTSAPKMDVAIALSAGNPVAERNEFFGEAIQVANRLSYIAKGGKIVISSELKNHYKQPELNFSLEENVIKILKPDEEKFLNRLIDITEKFWNEEKFDVVEFSRQMGLSKSQLYRQITSLTGCSPNRFIKEFRLNKALELIQNQQANISEISYEIGFGSPSYFSKCFQERFDILPSEYKASIS